LTGKIPLASAGFERGLWRQFFGDLAVVFYPWFPSLYHAEHLKNSSAERRFLELLRLVGRFPLLLVMLPVTKDLFNVDSNRRMARFIYSWWSLISALLVVGLMLDSVSLEILAVVWNTFVAMLCFLLVGRGTAYPVIVHLLSASLLTAMFFFTTAEGRVDFHLFSPLMFSLTFYIFEVLARNKSNFG